MYKPKGFQSITEGQATLDWLLTHSLKHIIWNYFKAKIYLYSGKYNQLKERLK